MTALVLPFMAFALTRDRGQVDWIEQPTLHAVLLLIREMVGYGRIWLPALYAALCCFAVVPLVRYAREEGRGVNLWRYGLVLLWLTLPTLLVIALSSVKPLLVNRYLIVSLPALSLFAAAGVDRLGRTSLRLTALLVLAGFSLHGIQGYFRNYWPASPIPDQLDQFRFPYLREEIGRENWAAVAEALYSQAGPEDAVLVTYRFDTVPLEHYRQRLNVDSNPALVFPRYWPDRSNRAGPGKHLLEQLPREYERVWVVMRNSEDPKVFGGKLRRKIYEASILAPLNRLYAESTRQVFPGITLILFARPHRAAIVQRQPA
jgi:hypothetical protein